MKRAQLEGAWARLKGPAVHLLRAAGVQGRAAFTDFLWAYSTFWCGGQPRVRVRAHALLNFSSVWFNVLWSEFTDRGSDL